MTSLSKAAVGTLVGVLVGKSTIKPSVSKKKNALSFTMGPPNDAAY